VLVGSLLHACQANDQHMLVLLDSNNMLMLGLIAAINKSLLGSTYTKISAYWAIMQQMVLYWHKSLDFSIQLFVSYCLKPKQFIFGAMTLMLAIILFLS
jgi:hypothetical protein